jgi:clan AA aspartic protease
MDGHQAIISVPFIFPGQPNIAIDFVIDTGFEGALTLPPAAVVALGLPYFQPMAAKLANDAPDTVDGHVAAVRWDGQDVSVLVLSMGSRPLLGTSLLNRKELLIQFVTDGLVTVDDI